MDRYHVFKSSPERWLNKPSKNVRPSVHPSVHTSTIKLNAATNQIVEFVKVDETFTTIWLSRSSEVRVKVMWDLKFQKWRFSNSISSTILQPVKKFQRFLILDQNIWNLSGHIFQFTPSYRVTRLQSLPKNRLYSILMKFGMMLEVDETFMMIWPSRSSEVRVKVRKWPQSPFGTIFTSHCFTVL